MVYYSSVKESTDTKYNTGKSQKHDSEIKLEKKEQWSPNGGKDISSVMGRGEGRGWLWRCTRQYSQGKEMSSCHDCGCSGATEVDMLIKTHWIVTKSGEFNYV